MKLSNNNILKEWYKEPVEQKKVMIYPACMSSSEASEIAEQEGLEKEWMGAKAWFEGVVESREEFEMEKMPKYHDFVCHMDYIESDLYYDFAGDYYFAVYNKLKTENMKKNKITITENELKQIVAESVRKILNEELDSMQEPKYKVGDKVEFKFDGGTWVGSITDTKKFPSCWNYKIYDFWHNEWDIIGRVE